MTALNQGLSSTIERFASPLNFNANMSSYYSMYKEDQLFGANYDAFGCKWVGSSQADPEYSPESAEKALRWAIFSAQQADEPTLILLMVQRWTDTGTSYTRWLSHLMVQELITLPKGQFKMQSPKHWSGQGQLHGNAKSNICCLLIANTAGLETYLK